MIEVNFFTVVVFLIAVYCVVKSVEENGMKAYEEAKQSEQQVVEEV